MRRVLPLSVEQPLFDTAATRGIEQREAARLEPRALMIRAGHAVARLATAVAPHAQVVWIIAGPGNNGGDGLEASVHLQRAGKAVRVSLVADPAALPADACAALNAARAAGVRIDVGPVNAHGAQSQQVPDAASSTSATMAPDLVIDALLGLGGSRAPAGPIADAISAINALGRPVLAIDLPSGLHPDTGRLLGDAAVIATHTLALLTLKSGLFTGVGRDQAGEVWLDTLGAEAGADPPPLRAWLSGLTPWGRLPPRRHAQNKGSFGDLAVVGGSQGMSGAALLGARAAHAAGAGRVYVDLLDDSERSLNVDLVRPELMFRHGWSGGSTETLAKATVVCGGGGGDGVRAVLPRLIGTVGRLVLDADALTAIALDDTLATLLQARGRRGRPAVLTPHPLEAARLLHCGVDEVQADRLRSAETLATRLQSVVVLKGSGSVIAAPNAATRVNTTGNASLATAGTGDVLAGWLGGRWAQAAKAEDEAATAFAAACHAVAEHGAAAEGDLHGVLRANDLVERLHALR